MNEQQRSVRARDTGGRPRPGRARDTGGRPRSVRVRDTGGRPWSVRVRDTGGRPRPGRARDRGQAAIEYLGFLPILLLVGLAGLQLGIAAYAAQQAGTAARAAARAASSDDEEAPSPEAAADAAVSGWVASRSSVSRGGAGGEATYTVTVEIPSVVPFWEGLGSVRKTATMPMPDEEDLP
ncbi:TadE/TadG family type IV pilus assembly protein [Streptomyces sp. NPDC013012]|uniref:TadE/TadG family type IV pilus assembly protein n=1 Tax=Streptomyces sp. NPDC013012 TaxID=3364860 RepID=UPI0036BBD556